MSIAVLKNRATLAKTGPLCYILLMRRDEMIARLKEAEPKLRDFGVAALYLFGSYARDEGRSDSDVDVFVDPVSDTGFDFLKWPIQQRSATGRVLALKKTSRGVL